MMRRQQGDVRRMLERQVSIRATVYYRHFNLCQLLVSTKLIFPSLAVCPVYYTSLRVCT